MEIRDIFVGEMAACGSRRGGRCVYRPFACVWCAGTVCRCCSI